MSTGLFDLLALQGITHPSTNVSSAIDYGFETKADRYAMYLDITLSTFNTYGWIAVQSDANAKTITSAMAKKLAGVVAGEEITFYAEMRANNLAGSRAAFVEIRFFDESGTQQGVTTTVSVSASGVWERKKERITVPANATRVNMYFQAQCGAGETVKTWLANVKITR